MDQWYDFLEAGITWEAAQFMANYNAWMGVLYDVPWDDNFPAVTVPILSVNPAGGFGRMCENNTTLLSSKDITHLNIQLLPDEQAIEDFAHIDIFIANNAEDLVWQPMLEWIKKH